MNDLSEFTRIPVEEAAGNLRASVARLMAIYCRELQQDYRLAELLELRSVPGQIDQITAELEQFSVSEGRGGGMAFPIATTGRPVTPEGSPLPDPRMIRKLIRLRRIRERFFDTKLFSDPAWDMLLDLTAAYGENRPVTVSSLCAASGLPMATALRRIDDMIAAGLIERQPDKTDRRRIFVVPTEKAAESIGNFFAEVDCPTMMV